MAVVSSGGAAAALLSSFLLIFLLFSPSSANEGNILVTGDILATDSQLSVDSTVFVIQNDCNLVLYNKGHGFQSNTSGRSTKCTVTLSDYGQLIITDFQGKLIWSSKSLKHPKGEYAAILQPDGEVGIYGPSVWSTPVVFYKEVKLASVDEESAAGSAPNLLFSSEVLKGESELVSRDYALRVTKDCGLRLTKSAHDTVVWKSPSFAACENCFARLNHHGHLSLFDDNHKRLWSSHSRAAAAAPKGEYVLAVKINGEATIYGPRIWTTAV